MIDLGHPDTYARGIPHDVFRELRQTRPVAWQPEPDGPGFWAITRYADVVSVLKNPTLYSSFRGSALLEDPPPAFLAKLRENMLNRDPPDHTKLRKLTNHVFSPKRITSLEQRIEAYAKQLVDDVLSQKACDFAVDVAGKMPLFVICEILGVPVEDRERLYALTGRMFGSTIADRAAAMRDGMLAAEEMRAYGAELALRRRSDPGEDLVSDLVAAEIDGHKLTDGQLQAFFMLLFNAGSDTTRSLLCYGLDLLLEHPDSFTRLREDPSLLGSAIEEMLRYEPAVILFRRTATADAEIAGQRIREGEKVVVFFPSANRDEEVFRDAERFEIARTPNHHLAFGHGTHFCLGAPLARMESRAVFREVLWRMRDIQRVGPLTTNRTNFIRSVHHQPIAWA